MIFITILCIIGVIPFITTVVGMVIEFVKYLKEEKNG